ncbi:MAG: sorbosone dehydrogenase family protein [Gemmatimonadota bacterium]
MLMALQGCGRAAQLTISEGTGPTPTIPVPQTSLIPTIHVVKARGWRAGETPVAAQGLAVHPFAQGLVHPRWLYVLPNGDVLVAETNAPVRPDDATGIRGWFFRRFMARAGGAVPSPNRITLLRDADGDGVAELHTTLLSGLASPFGMALVNGTLYIANTDAVVRVPYATGDTTITSSPARVVALPAGRRNHHWTKSLIASPDGTRLFVGVGSNSNAAENGLAVEEERAAVWEVDPSTGSHRIFASGLRNPVGMAWQGDRLWVAVNERDELGSDLVPDYMTALRDGAFYGWPFSYFGTHVDTRVQPQRPERVASALVPDYALGPHTASLGLAAAEGNSLGAAYAHGMFVGQHGSWNRAPFSGYKVIFVPFSGGVPSAPAYDVLIGFLRGDGEANGRPVGVALDRRGALLVADDVGNTIWRVTTQR